jgi:hypothetical protein
MRTIPSSKLRLGTLQEGGQNPNQTSPRGSVVKEHFRKPGTIDGSTAVIRKSWSLRARRIVVSGHPTRRNCRQRSSNAPLSLHIDREQKLWQGFKNGNRGRHPGGPEAFLSFKHRWYSDKIKFLHHLPNFCLPLCQAITSSMQRVHNRVCRSQVLGL